MTLANGTISLADQQHIVLDDVSWEFYEQLLHEIGNRQIRVTYDEGTLEIMSPLPKHELWGAWINRLVELICLERSIPVATLGSTTFRSRPRRKGLEPDKCFYIENVQAGLELDGEFDPKIHPAPDLAVEIDITSRSIARQPIYAALGVKELWRFDAKRLQVLHLVGVEYIARDKSISLPFLVMPEFEAFVLRMREKDQMKVLREFRRLDQFPPYLSSGMTRCHWARNEFSIPYHDKEWGVPQHDDRGLFEFLILEGAQAGLSWDTILKKRENYRKAFANFDPKKVAKFGAAKQAKLLQDPGIVRNRLKVASAVTNAKAFLAVQKEFGSFDAYIWGFVGGKPIVNSHKSLKTVPARTAESDAMSKDLLKRGFKFVGSTICYAFMQAVGMVNDHQVDCFRYRKVADCT